VLLTKMASCNLCIFIRWDKFDIGKSPVLLNTN
jgi:hypothetical protein